MKRFFAVMMFAAALTAADTKAAKPKKEPGQRQTPSVTMTGCVDERGEKYVLTGDNTMQASATLQGRAFDNDNFARFVGHKVRVTGESKEGVFHVDKIDKIAETCH